MSPVKADQDAAAAISGETTFGPKDRTPPQAQGKDKESPAALSICYGVEQEILPWGFEVSNRDETRQEAELHRATKGPDTRAAKTGAMDAGEQLKSEVDAPRVLDPLTICIGAGQEIRPVARAVPRKSRAQRVEAEPAVRQRSSLDAMQDLLRQESTLVAKALLDGPILRKVETKDVPDTVEEAMRLLLRDSRGFLQWAVDAKREQLEKKDDEVETQDASTDIEAEVQTIAEGESCVFGIERAAVMDRYISVVVISAIVLMVAMTMTLLFIATITLSSL
ncbi:hypothetical protein CLAFUW4_09910 [Fulvia fulva]|uniref:Transmembrane protein n=1 Tax=Passalora fulva TaxID=5499 RepID=A0A9Q8PHN2_PASFU|nr:uncharacterized protein CLAFUR5_12330 [Fulvia fulva]KAK4615458.1 hypothetical protein CLAFUR4_09915 [Fulvia fulva]KAK4617253.1 hypothetical protein CLAFUR0_09909 [Fulvia fulva]UJO22648.1 hypothetical protein CLAFUR5_12330 [Fulvia fulva]WPV19503.1 hypothetical protein CLAFUW4_09910 [Fulvia fulva]WPV33762.1 hypothetical protein CLAFUW7_09912 [Fulvia fulva]